DTFRHELRLARARPTFAPLELRRASRTRNRSRRAAFACETGTQASAGQGFASRGASRGRSGSPARESKGPAMSEQRISRVDWPAMSELRVWRVEWRAR